MDGLTRQFSVVGGEPDLQCLKIAFATDDGKVVNQHFGTAKTIAIYSIDPNDYRLLNVAEFESIGAEGVDDKLAAKLEFLNGCIAVYCRACGASAVKQLLEQHIQPLKVVEDSLIVELIEAFQKELNEGPSSWLAKAILRYRDANEHELEHGWYES